MLDNYEEQRNLHITEWNFRNIVKNRLHHLLLCKQEYWKKRCIARWAKLRDENTAFFHSMGTVRYRRNSIATLTREDGSIASEHFEKARILWQTYRERLGVSIDIDHYLSEVDNLEQLSVPFTHEEIDKLVAS
jgi:hypothetical protein